MLKYLLELQKIRLTNTWELCQKVFIVDKYNNTYHQTIKVKPIDLKPDSHAEYNVDSNEKDHNFPKLGIK